MPTYVYQCKFCDIKEDKFLSINHDVQICPNCKKEMTRLFQTQVFNFEGADFYCSKRRKKIGQR